MVFIDLYTGSLNGICRCFLGLFPDGSALHPTLFDVDLDKLLAKLKDSKLYNFDGCVSTRETFPQASQSTKGSELPDSEFSDQSLALQEWIKEVCGGSEKLKSRMEPEQWNNFGLKQGTAPRVNATGPVWQATNFADFMFSKTIINLGDGDSHFVAAIPMTYFSPNIVKGGKNIIDCSEMLNNMTRDELEENGGFFVFLKAGQGVTVPPGHLIFECNHGGMDFTSAKDAQSVGSDILVSQLFFAQFSTSCFPEAF